MTFVKLKKRFFANNTIRSKNNIRYIDDDPDTWVYDNYLNTKNIISLINHSEINNFDYDQEISKEKLNAIKGFFIDLQQSQIEENSTNFSLSDFKSKMKSQTSDNISNNDISAFNFRNFTKINKTRSKFIVDDNFLYKKNVIKNSLYKHYNNVSNELYKDLNFGFCNYHTVNFFTMKENCHKNFICYANPFINEENKKLYDFEKNSFTISFKVIFRSLESLNKPNCLLHIPGVINVYFIKSNNKSIRCAVILGEDTYKNILEIEDFENCIYPDENHVASDLYYENGIITGHENFHNLFINEWENLTIKYDSSSKELKLIKNENILIKANNIEITGINNIYSKNNIIMLGNKPKYSDVFKESVSHNFHFVFDSLFSKDNDVEYSSLLNKDIFVPVSFTNVNNIDEIDNSNFQTITSESIDSESFTGEISDFRIYNSAKKDSEIKQFYNSYIKKLQEEIKNNLTFYLPVFYVPLEILEKQVIDASGNKVNLKYNNFYNTSFANTCGGLEINSTNFLVEFVKCSKPNIVINGTNSKNFYENTFIEKMLDIVNNNNSFNEFKKGRRYFEVYNEKFINLEDCCEDNFYFKNLLILPNDNGIPSVDFNIIQEFIENISLLKYKENVFLDDRKDISYYNVSISNVYLEENFITNMTQYINTPENRVQVFITNELDDIVNININSNDTILNTFSNILFHDKEFDKSFEFDPESIIKRIYDLSKRSYAETESNPAIRNVFKSDIILSKINTIKDDVPYFKVPLPYSDINKDKDSNFSTLFDISNKIYNTKILKNHFLIKDTNFVTGNAFKIKDNGLGLLYRADCDSKVAEWNYVGNIFYKEGLIILNNPVMSYFSEYEDKNFEVEFKAESFIHVKEINVPVDANKFNFSQNSSHDKDLRHNEAAFNSEESFAYITDINLHDENFNVVSRAKLARPIPKKDSDKMIFKLKMDY
jgi:hypothetical protein